MTTFRHRACVKHRQARRARVIFLRLCLFVCTRSSLCSKRFRLVSDQRKTEERDSRFSPREEWNKSQKMKVGGRGRAHPFPALSLTPFFAQSLTLVPRSLLLNRTESACYAGYTRADKFSLGQILFLDRLFRDGPLEKSACTNFCFRSLLVQEFFFRWNPLHDFFFFRQILPFFEQWNLISLSLFLCFINYSTLTTEQRIQATF